MLKGHGGCSNPDNMLPFQGDVVASTGLCPTRCVVYMLPLRGDVVITPAKNEVFNAYNPVRRVCVGQDNPKAESL